jgi:choline dehydrogenase-like flavoprotein
MMGKSYELQSYQYHQLAIGFRSTVRPEEYLHGQITTLKTALVHPVIQNLPLDTATSIHVFRNLRSGLGVVNLNLFDRRRESNYVTLQVDNESNQTKLVINYTPSNEEPQLLNNAMSRIKQLLWKLKCIVPPGMVQIRPMGASVHYSGIMPMMETPSPYCTTKYSQCHDFENLYVVDGSSMPFLPAKNITFTLMANAVRVAESKF